MTELRVCIDRQPPPKTDRERLALVKDARWQPGDVIRATFMDGDLAVQQKVEQVALTWMEHANLTLYLGDDPEADIRISFQEQGSWSYIGTQCHQIPRAQPTMNYGWLTPDSSDDEVFRVVLHEFGHALGCIHEHQNPAGGINWNKKAVYEYYAGPPNLWSPEEVDHNLFETYAKDLTVYSDLDAQSIMMYPIPREFTLDEFEVGLNTALSEADKEFIRQQYP
jgi:hypothetical protein